jgi:hypothetical protein
MRQLLAAPAEFGDARLAPTTELAGLAELASLRSQDERLQALCRIAAAIQAEDAERRHVAEQRTLARAGLTVLPRRGL